MAIIPQRYIKPMAIAIIKAPITLRNARHLQFSNIKDPLSVLQLYKLIILMGVSQKYKVRQLWFNLNINMQPEQQLEIQLRDIVTFSNKFQFNKTDSNTSLLVSRNHTYMIKDMVIAEDDKSQLPSILETLALHQNLSRKYLLTLLHYQIYKGSDKAEYIKAIYEYGNVSLKQEIENRLTLGTPFQEDELWAIFAMAVKALFHLEQKGIVYGVLGTDKIFVNENVKLLDPSATATDPLLISQGRLYSPQIIQDKQDINMFKSDVYVLALMIIECGLLVDLSKQVELNLEKYLEQFEKIYSYQLFKLLQSMLSYEPEDRPSFSELRDYLIQQMELNTTKCNQCVNACIPDQENQPTPTYSLQPQAQQKNDILYQSTNYGEISNQSSFSVSQYQYSDLNKAKSKYLIAQAKIANNFSAPLQNRNINSAKKVISPLSTQKNSRIFERQQNSRSKNQHRYQNKENNEQKDGFETKRTKRINDKQNVQGIMLRHQYSKSTDCFQNIKNKEQSLKFSKQSTKQLKRKLVKSIHDNDEIQEQDAEQEQNSQLFSNSFNNIQSIRESRRDTAKKSALLQKLGKNLAKDNSTFRSSVNSNRNSGLYTDPGLLKQIHEDLAHFSTTKNSGLYERQSNGWFQ